MSSAASWSDNNVASAINEAAVRSELYRVLACSFRFPSADFFDAIKSGDYAETLRELIGAAGFSRPHLDADLSVLAGFEGDFDHFCAEYIRIFEVGGERPKPLCPLYGGEYSARPRLDVMEELVRFYSYFDLVLSDSDRELPDHICVELEFLHYLSFREARAFESSGDVLSLRRAQADFIERHPGTWLPLMRDRLEASDAPAFFRALASLTARVLEADQSILGLIGAP